MQSMGGDQGYVLVSLGSSDSVGCNRNSKQQSNTDGMRWLDDD